MPIQKTIEILDIPKELPMGRTILTFTPAPTGEYVCPECGKTAHTPNAVTIAALEEGDAMTRGGIPANRFHSIEELFADLDSWCMLEPIYTNLFKKGYNLMKRRHKDIARIKEIMTLLANVARTLPPSWTFRQL